MERIRVLEYRARAEFGNLVVFHRVLNTIVCCQCSEPVSTPHHRGHLRIRFRVRAKLLDSFAGIYITAFMALRSGYGTLVDGNNINQNESTSQEDPLLGLPRSQHRWRKHMMVNVHRDWADMILLACYAITGLLDSASISTWGSFVSMQTGLFRFKYF